MDGGWRERDWRVCSKFSGGVKEKFLATIVMPVALENCLARLTDFGGFGLGLGFGFGLRFGVGS